MPKGLIVFQFNDRIGMDLRAKYPEDLEVSNQAMMRIYQSHAFEETSGYLSLIFGALNIASYCTGMQTNYFISLLLSREEDPDSYEDAIIDASRHIMMDIDHNRFMDALPSLFYYISIYPTLKDEQKLAMVNSDSAKKIILERLEEDGFALKIDLESWMKEKLDQDYIDIDALLNSLIKLGLVKTSSVKELPSECIFLTSDFFVTRIPPGDLIKLAKKGDIPRPMDAYFLSSVEEYFRTYDDSMKYENLISEIIADTDTYNIINLLRGGPVSRNDLDKHTEDVRDLSEALQKMKSGEIITVLKDKEEAEHYFLKTDIRIERYYPEYLIDLIRRSYNNGTVSKAVLIEHLKHLREAFIDLKGHTALFRVRIPFTVKKIDETIKWITKNKKDLPEPVMRSMDQIYNEVFKKEWKELEAEGPVFQEFEPGHDEFMDILSQVKATHMTKTEIELLRSQLKEMSPENGLKRLTVIGISSEIAEKLIEIAKK